VIPGPLSERALVLAPTGRDSRVAVQVLKEAGFPAEAVADLPALVRNLEKGAGLAIIADEALQTADVRGLVEFLGQQPAWSDLPIVLMTSHGGGPERNPAAGRLADLLGNVTFLERPFHPTTLASVVRTAVRSRRRQYEARARLIELADLTQTLEQRVEERSLALMDEVSARERAQDQLRQAQKLESIGKLTGGVAHDFNNLLAAVMGNLELLRKRIGDDERALRYISGAVQGAERGAALTQRLLAFARQQDLTPQPVDLKALIGGMSDLLERSLGPQILVTLKLPANLPPAKVDANQVELAILNLAINARDAMPDGGEIIVSLREETAKRARDLAPGKYLRIDIADTGCGMSPEVAKMAIEPFFSTKPVGKGTGLGLSMVHGLAIQLGGNFALKSAVGRGTTATLWLPVAPPEARPVEIAPQVQSFAPVRPATILLVDDDPLIATSTSDMLEDLGHTVIERNSGQSALEVLRGHEAIDLMVTDYAMAGMTGVELALEARELRPKMPILLATGYADLTESSGFDLPRLAKPYQQAQLRQEIERLLA
jgi:signal transduction histidine kinase